MPTNNLGVDALSVVPDQQTKLALVIPDLHFDPPRLCVPECVAHRLACNPVDLVADQRSEISWCAFDLHTKLGTILAGLIGGEFFCERADCQGQVVGTHRRGAQPHHRIPALGDRPPGLLDDILQRLLGFGRAIPDQVGHSVKLHQHTLKTLQQGVV